MNMTQEDNSEQQGYQIREGLHGRTVAHASQVPDNATVVVDGMEIKASMAREMGLLNAHVPDSGLSVGNAVAQTQVEPTPAPIETTGHEQYDQTVSELNAQVEAGAMTEGEASEYSTALGQVALAGLTVAQVSETIDGLVDGSINPVDLNQNQRDVVSNLENTVTTAATKSAMSELGEAGFKRIAEIAKGDAEFNGILRQYASMRALGKASHTWPEFLADAEAWSQGDR